MKPEHRQNVVVVLAEPYGQMRRALRGVMMSEGFRNVSDIGDVETLRQSINDPMPDVLVVDINLPGGPDCTDLIRDIRGDKLGRNPFVPIIGTTWEADRERVKKAVDAGIDDLLVKPVAPGTVIERIEILARNRKPFVVTSDYIGPDRRKPEVRRSDSAPTFEVPNSLKLRAEGKQIDMNAWALAKRQSLEALNLQRLKAAAFQVSFLAVQIIQIMAALRTDQKAKPLLERLILIENDLSTRAGSSYVELKPLCESIGRVAKDLLDLNRGGANDSERLDKNLKLLKQVADGLLIGFNPGQDAKGLADQVVSAIARFQARTENPPPGVAR